MAGCWVKAMTCVKTALSRNLVVFGVDANMLLRVGRCANDPGSSGRWRGARKEELLGSQ
jgi:hypothetical protein